MDAKPMSADSGLGQICSWCRQADEHGEPCNQCSFCEGFICCECWDGDEVCYYPGEGYCPACKKKLRECPKCVAYLETIMKIDTAPICEDHWN